MESLEYIDSYFKGDFQPDQKIRFEERIRTDEDFAEEVAFYLTAIKAARIQNVEDKKERFREIYFEEKNRGQKSRVKRLWIYTAAIAAMLTALIFGANLYLQPIAPPQLAGKYIKDHFRTMGIQMGNSINGLEKGKSLYNEGKYREALQTFEQLIQTDSSDYAAREFAGITALQLQNFEKAVTYFSQMENNATLHVNPGKFYHALALMKRNLPEDKEVTKSLLTEVVKDGLAGSQDAREFLKHY